MIRPMLVGCAALLLLTMQACKGHEDVPQGAVSEAFRADASSVAFDMTALPSDKGLMEWMATYTSQGKTAKFRIELGSPQGSPSNEVRISFGKGRFVAEPGSDAGVLLVDLKKALQAKVLPSKVKRKDSLAFTFANLGEHQSRDADGAFLEKPAGNWTAMKIFIEEGEQEGEVFLNLNPVLRKGEFSIKDPDYGDFVLAKLATVL